MKPEVAYFLAENGKRTSVFVIDIPDATHLPRIAEPWFLAFNAEFESTPAFIPAEMEKIVPPIEAAVRSTPSPPAPVRRLTASRPDPAALRPSPSGSRPPGHR